MALLTVNEAADHFHCDPSTIRRHMWAWPGAVIRVGRLIRLDPERLPKAVDAVQNTPTPKPRRRNQYDEVVYGDV